MLIYILLKIKNKRKLAYNIVRMDLLNNAVVYPYFTSTVKCSNKTLKHLGEKCLSVV